MKQTPITINILSSESYDIACLYIRHIYYLEHILKDGDDDEYCSRLKEIEFYNNELEKIKPIVQQTNDLYQSLVEIDWKYNEDSII
jgi:hypothetical protein